MLRRFLLLLVLALMLHSSLILGDVASCPTRWQSSNEEKQWEKAYLNLPAPENIRRHLLYYTEEPHLAGSERDYQTAVYTRDRLKEYGINAEIKEYWIWLPYPKELSVEMLAPTPFKASLREEGVPEDKDSFDTKITPVYNAYSASGNVTGQLVYVNYGLPEDYQKLTDMNISVKGKIVIARYGRAFRGVKAKVAEQQGAIGLLIYSDPADDGYGIGDIYPRGPYRSASSAQRGSVIYTFQYAGDPLTPGVAATKDARRLPVEQAENLPKIPVQPLSYKDAAPLLESLGGLNVPRGWQGGLPFPYHIGPGSAEVRLKTEFDYQLRPIWNVIGEIKGVTEPEKLVILGNHRDAWVYGAADPNSGSATMLEVARGLGELLKKGWKPARTILLGSWDAEEFGLIGSTEWVEEHAQRLSRDGVVYINVDLAVSGGNFNISGVPSLKTFCQSVMAEIIDPNSGKPLLETWAKRQRNNGNNANVIAESDLQLGNLGSGSDFTPFLQHIGVPAIDMGFSGSYGVYHSAYDSFYWMEKFGDPGFSYHAAMARVWGLMAIRLATTKMLPFEYGNYAQQVKGFIDKIDKESRTQRLELDLTQLQKAASDFQQAAERFNNRLAVMSSNENNLKAKNELLIQVERAFIEPSGLPMRAWYRHLIFVPGYYAGYNAEVLSGLQQAVTEKDAGRARLAAAQIAAALLRAQKILNENQLSPANP